MELLLVPVPLFDKYLAAEAYLFRYQMANQAILYPTQKVSPPLEALNAIGSEAFAGGKPLFVPVSVAMLEDLAESCTAEPDVTVFLLEDLSVLDGQHLSSMALLLHRGYRFAVIQRDKFIDNDSLLKLVDFVLFGDEAMAGSDRKAMALRYTRLRKQIQVVATGIKTPEDFEVAKKDGFHLYEGMFYRVPVRYEDRELAPIKANLIRLLNLVRDQNFEFRDIADVMRRDPALSYSLMRFINSPYLGMKYKVKSIQHAVTILGQMEVRKWVTAAVFRALGSDRPSELTRISLIRAKFAENLAADFELGADAQGLFLMGLFSVLDTMLNTTMEQALNQVMVSDDIADALIRHTGRYVPVIEFVVDYEKADWQAVMRHSMIQGLFIPNIYTAYLGAVGWYNELISEADRARAIPYNPQTTLHTWK